MKSTLLRILDQNHIIFIFRKQSNYNVLSLFTEFLQQNVLKIWELKASCFKSF